MRLVLAFHLRWKPYHHIPSFLLLKLNFHELSLKKTLSWKSRSTEFYTLICIAKFGLKSHFYVLYQNWHQTRTIMLVFVVWPKNSSYLQSNSTFWNKDTSYSHSRLLVVYNAHIYIYMYLYIYRYTTYIYRGYRKSLMLGTEENLTNFFGRLNACVSRYLKHHILLLPFEILFSIGLGLVN